MDSDELWRWAMYIGKECEVQEANQMNVGSNVAARSLLTSSLTASTGAGLSNKAMMHDRAGNDRSYSRQTKQS